MRVIKLTAVLCAVLAVMAGNLYAQSGTSGSSGRRTTPSAGTWAGGVDAGFANPLGNHDFDAAPTLDVYLEYFSTPHVSWRGMLGFVAFDGPEVPGPARDDVDLITLNANVLYQWEGGVVHPFVTGGVGLYNYDPDLGDTELKPGLNAGGGLNFYTSKHFAIKVEGLVHATDAREPDSYLTGTVGARWLWGNK